jgi:hypothetical protein
MTSLDHDIAAYEAWLCRQCEVVPAGLEAKRKRMGESAFLFLRATYFRWARLIESLCPDLRDAPRTSCVGDIHVENFGIWRDADARMVWGVNDFDEAAVMPYAYDLIRLVTSARLAPGATLARKAIAAAILDGYRAGLAEPRPMLIDENAVWLRSFTHASIKSVREFWQEIEDCASTIPPEAVVRMLCKSLPKGAEVLRFASRVKGGGSLGRPRFIVIASWNCGTVLREAKALVPSAWSWAHAKKGRISRFMELAGGAYRSPDPKLRMEAGYIVRRLAPDSCKIEIKEVEPHGLTPTLLSAMGADLGAVHAAGARPRRIQADLEARDPIWLERAAQTAEKMARIEFASFRSARVQSPHGEKGVESSTG